MRAGTQEAPLNQLDKPISPIPAVTMVRAGAGVHRGGPGAGVGEQHRGGGSWSRGTAFGVANSGGHMNGITANQEESPLYFG